MARRRPTSRSGSPTPTAPPTPTPRTWSSSTVAQRRPGRHPDRPEPGRRGLDRTPTAHTIDRRRHLGDVQPRRTAAATAARSSGSDLQLGDRAGSFDCTYADGPSSHTRASTVSDGDGGSRLRHDPGHGHNVAPTIAISGAANVNEGSAYSLTLGAVTDPGTDTVSSYVVHWGDGNTDTYALERRQDATPTPTAPNNHNITVDLVDEDGTFLDRANAHSVTSTTSLRRSRSAARRTSNEGSAYSLPWARSPTRAPTRSPATSSTGATAASTPTPQRRQDAHLRRRPDDHDDHGRPGRRGRHLPRSRRTRSRSRRTTSLRRRRTCVSPADNATTGDNTPDLRLERLHRPGRRERHDHATGSRSTTTATSPARRATRHGLVRLHARRLPCGWHVLLACECERRGRRHERVELGPPPHDRHRRAERALDQPGERQPDERSSVDWTVTFSESVTGVDSGDFASSRAAASPARRSPAVSGTATPNGDRQHRHGYGHRSG